jgi:hypothetical protein
MRPIRVDDEVIAVLTSRGKFGDSFNGLVREALGLPRLESSTARLRSEPSGRLAQLITEGLLEVGQTVTWHRRNLGETYHATVTSTGRMMMRDGQTYASPDACASAIAGYPCKGWRGWKTQDGTSLQQLCEGLAGFSATSGALARAAPSDDPGPA